MRHILLILAMLLLCLNDGTAGARRAAGGHSTAPEKKDEVVKGVVVVKLKRGVIAPGAGLLKGAGTLGNLLTQAGATSLAPAFRTARHVSDMDASAGTVDLSRVYVARIPETLDPREVARRLSNSGLIEYAEPKFMNSLYDVPNDSGFAAHQLASFALMNAPAGWSVTHGDTNVIIADVDGGTDWQHEDLIGNLWINRAEDLNHNGRLDQTPVVQGGDLDGVDQDGNGFIDDVIGWNFGNDSDDPGGLPAAPGSSAHGTATASQFGATTNNRIGMAGTGWNCRVMPICAASPVSDGSIQFGYDGIQYAFMNGASVINCSWGRTGGFSQFEQDVLAAASQAGALVVVAAGNGTANNGVGKDNDVAPDYPANYKFVLAVGATQSVSDGVPSFSNYGISVPVYAPGVNTWSAVDGGGYGAVGSGTSFAAPQVSGLAGLLTSLHRTWTPEEIAAQIRMSADSIDAVNPSLAGHLGHGRVNFGRALTESHTGVDVDSAWFLTPAGRTTFVSGDTVLASYIITNILPSTATGLQFTLSTSDPALQVLQGTSSVSTLAQDQKVTLQGLIMKVGPLSANTAVAVWLSWISGSGERGASAFRLTLLSGQPAWSAQQSPTVASLFSVKAVDRNVVWAAGGIGSPEPVTVVRTVNGGARWTLNGGDLPAAAVYCVAAVDSSHAWVGTGDGGIFATTNGGVNWSMQSYPAPASPFIDALWFFDARHGYALGDPNAGAGKFIVLQTTDGGATWEHFTNEPAADVGEAGWNNSFWWTDARHGWFGSNIGRVWRTTDGGVTWSAASILNPSAFGVAFTDSVTGLVVEDAGILQRSTNGGASWGTVAFPSANNLASVAFVPGTASAWATDQASPLLSADRGSTWVRQSTSPLLGGVTHLSMADTLSGWAVTSAGEILNFNPGSLTAIGTDPGGTAPASLVLEQNYPNPFNPGTTIEYRLPAPGLTTVKVYDMLGREVAVLFQGQQAAGRHTVRFDGSGRASGMYFYRIRSGGLTASRKMLLIR